MEPQRYGYLMANWGIFSFKEAITAMSENIKVYFLDGRKMADHRACGGGKHINYASLDSKLNIRKYTNTKVKTIILILEQIRVDTILENSISAGISNELFNSKRMIYPKMTKDHRRTFTQVIKIFKFLLKITTYSVLGKK
jgi:hypothetical protein